MSTATSVADNRWIIIDDDPGAAVEELARQRIAEKCSYAFYFRDVKFQYRDGVLALNGRLGTFYLKQVLQSLLENLDGVDRIDNQVDVVSPVGLSSSQRG